MSKVPADRSEAVFDDFKKPYDSAQAFTEANRCLFCHDAPCIQACPTGIDIPQFIRKIATGNEKGSARTIFDQNIFGMSCARVCPVETLCVGDCVYNHMGLPPIQIGKLQRYATDTAYEQDWTFYEPGEDTGKTVGLIGGGPASIAAAHELRRLGHAVTIYESREVLGGLNTWGVAPYKMKADRSLEEVEWILQIGGIDVKTGVTVGPDGDVSVDALLQTHDAVFVGMGLGPDRYVPGGEQLDNVFGGVEWIEKMKLGKVDLDGVKTALVLGGGNTALDCVRELRGLGVWDVWMVYRGTHEQMSGYQHEFTPAKDEGVKTHWLTQPTGFTSADGKVTGVTCVTTGADKKPVAGSEHTLDADLVLIAIGQTKLGDLFGHLDGVTIDWGKIVTDDNGFTGHPGLYAGGDCRNGGKEVVNAAAEGRDAARAIHEALTGTKLPTGPRHYVNHLRTS